MDKRRCGFEDKSVSPLLDLEGEPAHNYARPEREWKGMIFSLKNVIGGQQAVDLQEAVGSPSRWSNGLFRFSLAS